MASTLHFLLFSSLLLLISSSSLSEAQRTKALLLPLSKDASTLQYLTTLNQRTPLVPVKLVVDLGANFLWVNCEKNYVSTTYRPARCGSAECNLARSKACGTCSGTPKPGCNVNVCGLDPYNPFIKTSTSGDLGSDVLSLRSTDGSNPGPYVTIPRFLFTCGANLLLPKLAQGATGIAGLGRTKIALPSQLASTFSFARKFAICLSSNGVVFFGDGPYKMLPNIDISTGLGYTPLIINPVSTVSGPLGEPSYEYFVGVKSIKIGEKVVPLNTTLLSIDKKTGNGGTKISTVDPYTVMHTAIYKAVTEAYVKEAAARKITRVAAVAPFGVCFSTKGVGVTRVGYAVPFIDLVFGNKVVWTIFGANSMVQVRDGVMCLGVVDGGSAPITSIVIGAYQLEDNLLQFDLAASKLGFSSSLLFRRTTCSNFNFTIKG